MFTCVRGQRSKTAFPLFLAVCLAFLATGSNHSSSHPMAVAISMMLVSESLSPINLPVVLFASTRWRACLKSSITFEILEFAMPKSATLASGLIFVITYTRASSSLGPRWYVHVGSSDGSNFASTDILISRLNPFLPPTVTQFGLSRLFLASLASSFEDIEREPKQM
jgi:hypothetical protein